MQEQKKQQEQIKKPPISKEVQAALWEQMRQNAYLRELHIEILEIERGYVKGKLQVTDKVLNPYGSVHGGCLFSLADITAGLAACTYGTYASTINGDMEYILPAIHTDYILCEAREIRQGVHVSQYEALLYDDKNQLVDRATFAFYMMNRPVVE